ncbi:PREDICTED: arrestin homolog [Papilio xuthus]|uniref:Arrestin homolog n=1 Tax=Papilio xuthus TaxID=66420 RepID=A0A194PR53_PAPXU|nr:PREDICTED: arrestin homolog [Papilio xuthus]KPI95438.1 Beta-arrestin-1 [Papilio xuthus]
MTTDNALNSQRVFKKSSPNNKLTLYLASRDLVVENGYIDKIQGVLHVEPECLENKKLFGQVTLTFRYGREDEEVMGLKFCNEAIMSMVQIWPIRCSHDREPNSPLQEALIKRLGANAFPFHLELTPLAPPSVQLVPAKQYHGAPIGTSYDVRAYLAERADEKISRRSTVRMGIRVLQGPGRVPPAVLPHSPHHNTLSALAHHNVLRLKNKTKMESDENSRGRKKEIESLEQAAPRATVEKPFLLSDGRVELEGWLDKATYSHGESIHVTIVVSNHSSKTVRRIKVLAIQHVDVCMFSNGKFKNVVALVKGPDTPVAPGEIFTDSYNITPHRGVTKNWIALEDSYSKSGASLASTVLCNSDSPDDRNVFAIYVSYYVKVKLTFSAMGGDLSLKLPFTLTHSCINEAPTDSVIEEATHKMILEGKENSDEEESKAETENDKQNNNGHDGVKQETAFGDDGEIKSPEDHKCIADVLVNIENKITDRPKKFEGQNVVRNVKPNEEELDLIVKYPCSDT